MVVVEVLGKRIKALCDCGQVVELWKTVAYREPKHCVSCKPKSLTTTQYHQMKHYNLTREQVVNLPPKESNQLTLVNGEWVRFGKRIKFMGLNLTLTEWGLVCGVSKQCIHQRLRRGVYDALKKYEDRILAYIANGAMPCV